MPTTHNTNGWCGSVVVLEEAAKPLNIFFNLAVAEVRGSQGMLLELMAGTVGRSEILAMRIDMVPGVGRGEVPAPNQF